MPMLSAHRVLHATSLDELCHDVESILGARFVKPPQDRSRVGAEGNFYRLPRSDLWFCSYSAPVTLGFGESDFVRVQFHRHGNAATRVGKDVVEITPTQSCVSGAAADIDFGGGYQQLAWRVPTEFLVQKLAAMTGAPVVGRLSFDHMLDLSSPAGRNLAAILDCIVNTIDTLPLGTAPLVLAELEQAMAVGLLCASRHSLQNLLDRRAPGAAPWQVRRAESYIEANWNRPLGIDEIAAATGTSARSLFRSFKEHRGYSVLEFAKRLRLKQAQRMLSDGGPEATVTEIALACGFGDLGPPCLWCR